MAASAESRLSDLFRTVGAAIHRRALRVAPGDETRAAVAAEALFVRLAVHRGGDLADARARWAWIYRAVTNYVLRSLPDDVRPGEVRGDASSTSSPPASSPPPSSWSPPDARSVDGGAAHALGPMKALRAFDEATQNIAVLARLDGLPSVEIADVLGLRVDLVEKKLAAWRAAAGADDGSWASSAPGFGDPPSPAVAGAVPHPSRLALDRDRADGAVAAHLADCAACRAVVEDVDGMDARFGARVTPEAIARVARAIATERARLASGPRWKRIFWLAGAFVVVTVMAFAVARPREQKPTETPFRGPGSASRAKSAGLQITVRRGNDVGALGPEAISRLGDRFHFRVRLEAPRYLEVRARGPGGRSARIFPLVGAEAALVAPGETLDHDYALEPPVASPGHTVILEGLFADHPFALDRPPGRDVEVVPVRIEVEP